LASLPTPNRAVLQYIASFLRELLANEEHTKMGSGNLAIVFGPLIIPHVRLSSTLDPLP